MENGDKKLEEICDDNISFIRLRVEISGNGAYDLDFYPGPDATSHRPEHKCEDGNFHYHVSQKGKELYKVNCRTIEDMDKNTIERKLKKYITDKKEPLNDIAKTAFEKGEVNIEAARKLQSRGIKVKVMGLDKQEIKLRQEYTPDIAPLKKQKQYVHVNINY